MLTKNKNFTPEWICADILGKKKKKFDVKKPKVQRFFGLEGLLDARGLVYLVHILEERYGIRFTAEDMDEEQFYTVDGMAAMVSSKLCPEDQ